MSEIKLVIEQVSKFGFDETVDLLTAESERRQWKIPAVHDLRQSLAKSGKSVRPVKVIEICKPEYSGQMLELSDERIMSVMMPCRISVYIKEDGKTYIALLNGAAMVSGMPAKIATVMKASSDETFEIVKSVMEKKG
ncbi:MAG: DUF302 domain-containing protein [Bacteroidales bacterium]